MGNERSTFENNLFRNLFRKQNVVDGTGYHYARLCRKAASQVPNARGDYLASSGNPALLRWLCVAVGTVAAAAMGGAMTDSFVARIFLVLIYGGLGLGASLAIQAGCKCFHLREKRPLYIALGCIALWMIVGILSGQWAIVLMGIAVQILGGLANAYGGRRSELGRQTASEILGFRHYLKTVTREELQRILKYNPDYYYEMAPYALALGVDEVFAKRFERLNQPNCNYLFTRMESPRKAAEWYPLLREVVNALNARQKRLRIEKLIR